mmetsp:Transcript_86832/g.230724  ORF Transcript_86832/g.230724 Transcript_86832/m.230724 type:complete len:108 (-) Transcript_86832:291-614(-)
MAAGYDALLSVQSAQQLLGMTWPVAPPLIGTELIQQPVAAAGERWSWTSAFFGNTYSKTEGTTRSWYNTLFSNDEDASLEEAKQALPYGFYPPRSDAGIATEKGRGR